MRARVQLTDALTLALAIAAGIGVGGWIASTILNAQLRITAMSVLAHPKFGQLSGALSKLSGQFGGGGSGGGLLGFAREGFQFLRENSKPSGPRVEVRDPSGQVVDPRHK